MCFLITPSMTALRYRALLRSLSTQPPPCTPASLRPFVERQGAVILDGGFGKALGVESEKHALWGAQHLFRLEGHNKLLDVHRTFLEAGSDVIRSVSYQVSFEMLAAANAFTDGTLPGGNISSEKFQLRYSNDVLRTSVELAKKARNEFWAKAQAIHPERLRPLVAASVGPAGDNVASWTGATDPNSHLPNDIISTYYRRKLHALCRAKPDLLALETLPGLREARLALSALAEVAPELAKLGVRVPPAWVTFVCSYALCWNGTQTPDHNERCSLTAPVSILGEHRSEQSTAAGDDFGDACAELAVKAGVHAIGVNCAEPSLVEPLLKRARLRVSPETLLLAYPNSGEVWDALTNQALLAKEPTRAMYGVKPT